MTDITFPGEKGSTISNRGAAHAISKSGGHDGYVVEGVDISEYDPSLDTSGVNSFANTGTDGLDFTVDGGEAFVSGWLCRDRPTTVTLPANTTSTVCVGFNVSAALSDGESSADVDNILVDAEDNFTGDNPRLPLYEVSATSSGINAVQDIRPLGRGEASAPWASNFEDADLVYGPLTIESENYREHLRLERPGVANWQVGPTSNGNGALEIYRSAGGDQSTFRFTGDNELYFEQHGDWAVRSEQPTKIQVSSSEPAEYDIWFEVE